MPLAAALYSGATYSQVPSVVESAKPERVEVTGSRVDERQSSTIAKIVVSREDILLYDDRTLGDVFKRLPSVSVTATETGSEVRMRGLAAGYTQLLVNGAAMPAGFSIDSIAPELVERVEIIRSSSAELGGRGIAGTINIVLRKTAKSGSNSVKVNVGQEAGRPSAAIVGQYATQKEDVNFTVVATASRALTKVNVEVRETGVDASGGQTFDRQGERLRHDQINVVSVAPRLLWQVSATDEIAWESVFGTRSIRGGTLERNNTLVGVPLQYESSNVGLAFDVATLQTLLAWKHDFGSGARLESKLRLTGDRRESDAVIDGFDAGGALALVRRVNSKANDRTLALSGKGTAPWTKEHDAEIGWDGSHSRRTETRRQHDESPTGISPINIDEAYDSTVSRLALFVQDDWKVREGLQVYAGIRWEGIRTSSVGSTIASFSTYSSVVSPIMQVAWIVPHTAKHRLRAGASRTYKPPTPSDLMPRRFIAKNNSPITPDTEGNPVLRPELAWGLDAAYEIPLGRKGLLSLSSYVRAIDDVIREDLIQRDGIWITRQINGGKAFASGIELDAKVLAKDFLGDSVPPVGVNANASWNRSTVRQVPYADNHLGAQIPFTANLGLTYQEPAHKLSGGVTFTFSRGTIARLTSVRSTGFGDSRTVGAFLGWRLAPDTSLRLSVGNLFAARDLSVTRYEDSSGMLEQTTSAQKRWRLGISLELGL